MSIYKAITDLKKVLRELEDVANNSLSLSMSKEFTHIEDLGVCPLCGSKAVYQEKLKRKHRNIRCSNIECLLYKEMVFPKDNVSMSERLVKWSKGEL